MTTMFNITNNINSVERAANALGVSPYGDDGRTFTAKEYKAETDGMNVCTLQTLRDNDAVIVDHMETFNGLARLTVTVRDRHTWHFTTRDKINIPAPLNEHDITLMLRASNPVAAFSYMSADLAKFFADNGIRTKDVKSCDYVGYDCGKTVINMDATSVLIDYRPEFEGRRNFYRFDLGGYVRRCSNFVNDDIRECEKEAAKYREKADEMDERAAKLRKLFADLH